MDGLQRYWAKIIEPKIADKDRIAYQNARMLASLVIIMLILGTAVVMVSALLDQERQVLERLDFILLLPGILLGILAVELAKHGKLQSASCIIILGLFTFIFAAALDSGNAMLLGFTVLPIVLSGMLLSQKGTLWIAALDLVVMFVISCFSASITPYQVFCGPFGLVVLATVLMIFSKDQTRILENFRREELRESEHRYRDLFEATFEGMVIHNQGVILEANTGFAKMFGYELEEVVGRPLMQFAALESQHIFRTSIPSGHALEFQGMRKNGARIGVELVSSEHTYQGRKVNVLAVRDITERKRTEEQLRHDALYDPLTNLPNRALFKDRLELAILRQKRRNYHKFAVLYLDLDRFKIINDSLGHNIGDELLIEVSKRIKSCMRAVDTVARLGGDEFVVLLEDIQDSFDAIHAAERILINIRIPCRLQEHEVITTASLGIVISDPQYTLPEQYLRDADTAMYHAKELGKARYEVFDTIMRKKIMNRLEMETDLRAAMDNNQFEIYYQPILSLASGTITGFEALLRWWHPRLGLVYPVEFISLAEETGLILEIGDWVLENACFQAHQWQKKYPHLPPLSMSVNLSGKQLMQPDLLVKIKGILARTELDPMNLSLEVTESVLIRDMSVAKKTLMEIKNLGIQVHMDDFGTGYSSLGHLHQFPIDRIKIDRSFTASMLSNKNNMGLVRSIVLMGHELGLYVVAEGIETMEQMSRLGELGCEYGQGYFLSKPLPAREAEYYLGHHKN